MPIPPSHTGGRVRNQGEPGAGALGPDRLVARLRPLLHQDRRPPRERILDIVDDIAAAMECACVLTRLATDPKHLDVVWAGHPVPEVRAALRDMLAIEPVRRDQKLFQGVMRGEPLFLPVVGPEIAGVVDPVARPLLERHPIGSLMALPIAVRAETRGVLILARAPDLPPFTPEQMEELQDVAERISLLFDAAQNELNAEALRAAQDAIVTIDGAGRILEFNPSAEEKFGRRREDVLLDDMASLIVPEPLRERHRTALRRLTEGGAPSILNRRIAMEALRADGTTFPVELTVAQLSEHPPRFVGFIRDMTVARRAEAERVERAERQSLVVSLGQRALAGADPISLAREALSTAAITLGLERGVALECREDGSLGRIAAFDAGAALHDPGLTEEAELSLARRPLAARAAEVVRGEDLPDGFAAALVAPVFGERGAAVGAVVLYSREPDAIGEADIDFVRMLGYIVGTTTERRRSEERIAQLGLHDVLTGLPNRALLADRLAQALERGTRTRHATALLVLDIDGFRALNDRYGHGTGDETLSAVAARLVRDLGPDATIGRLSADEFGVLVPEVRSEQAAMALAERLNCVVTEPLLAGGHELAITVSTGIALAEPGDEDAERLLAAADAAKVRASRLGGGRYELLTPAMRGRAAQRRELEQDLRRGVQARELEVHYQPIVSLRDGTIAACEALVRWRHPERGLLGPGQFLDIAEASGIVVELGEQVLGQACEAVARWSAAMPGTTVPPVHVNVSARQLADPAFAAGVVRTMERTGIDPSLLVLELTETLLMEDRDAALEDVSRLSALGVKIAIDDFGTGYASLARLRRLPFDTLKIDRSFIADLPGARREASLVEAMVRMSRSLGLTVVAEGLETTEQLAALHALGCDEAQGLLFSSAVEGDVFADMVRMGRRWDIAAAPPREPEQPHGEAIAGLGIGGDADEPLLSLSQAATALGVSTTTVRRWSNSGELASTRTVGGHRRFPASEVRRLRAERRPPSVRVGAAPVQALPALEAIVERSGTRLGQASWASLYDDTPGFFDDPAGAPHRERWLEAVARAAHTGNYAMLIEATETLMAEARRRGAPLLERHSALERFGEATARALARGGAPHAEVVETRRLFAHLRQRHLAASD